MRVVTERSAFRETAAAAPADARVPVEVRVRVADPFEAYRRARHGDGDDVFFETTGGQSGWGYFATDAVERLTVTSGAVSREDGSPSLAALDAETLKRGGCEVPYPCGLFGWLSYDVARELEDLPETTADDRGLPRLQFAKYDRVAAWREPWTAKATLRVTACPRLADHDSADAAYDCGVSRARDLVAQAVGGDRSVDRGEIEEGRARFDLHGKPWTVTHDGRGLFEGLEVGRYHSLAVDHGELPDALVETARTEDERRVVMGVRHREEPHVGVQFHPESILTDAGERMVALFCESCSTT
jgi:anthranilate synthase component 1